MSQTQRVQLQSAQKELEEWCGRIGGQRATSGHWQKGASDFLSNRFVHLYLEACLKEAKKSQISAGKYAHGWALMETDKGSEKGIVQCALDALFFLISDANDEQSIRLLAAIVGRRAEMCLFLNSPAWGKSWHLKGLRMMQGRDLSMSLIKKRLQSQGFNLVKAYKPLTAVERLTLGHLFIRLACQVTGLATIEKRRGKKKPVETLVFTERYWQFLKSWRKNLELYRPVYLPMIAPPRQWTGLTEGGYLSTITNLSSVQWERWELTSRRLKPSFLGAINYLQQQPLQFSHEQVALVRQVWELGHAVGKLPARDRLPMPNRREYEDLSQFWADHWLWKADKRKNAARSKVIHGLISYEKLKDFKSIWFVWFADYRGRFYQRGAQLNYLSSDPFRSMFEFGQSGPISGHHAEFAWALGEAWGLVKDQSTRDQFLRVNQQEIVAAGEEPLDYQPFWTEADKPFRFAQLCREWSRYSRDLSYQSHAVFQLDQTTSAYGHAACLLRDGWLAEFTNCTGKDFNDLYVLLGATTKALMATPVEPAAHREKEGLAFWAENPVPRELMKACVMPVIYRRSHQTMLSAIQLYLRDHVNNIVTPEGVRIMDLAVVLGKYINLACKSVLPGVADLHHWLVDVAKAQIAAGYRPYWLTPNGLVVESYSSEGRGQHAYLTLTGRKVHISAVDYTNKPVNQKKSVSALSADFIHSQDAAFLQRFIYHWSNYKHPIISVHDCVGTTIDQVAMMRVELQDQWARFYTEDWLTLMHRNISREIGKKIRKPPCVGTLSVNKLGENPFLFT